MFFTYQDTTITVSPESLVPSQDGPIPMSVNLKMSDDELLVAIDEYNLNIIRHERSTAYPPIVDQLDILYHGGYDAWKASIDVIKQQYPKP